jgi:predicted ATPase
MCAQRYEEALPQIDQALAYCEETGERWWQARIYQTRGQLLCCRKSRPDKCAPDCFRTAIEIARSQCARALELRAATNLARLLSERDQQREAYDTLASVYRLGIRLVHRGIRHTGSNGCESPARRAFMSGDMRV